MFSCEGTDVRMVGIPQLGGICKAKRQQVSIDYLEPQRQCYKTGTHCMIPVLKRLNLAVRIIQCESLNTL